MELSGKTINFLGDSITEGHGTSDKSRRFTDLIAAKYGVKANNYGIGGSRIARQAGVDGCNLPERSAYCLRCEDMDKDADAVVVFGGTNDYGHGDAPFGDFTDFTTDTYCGACRVLFEKLLTLYPCRPIVVITPLHRLNEDRPTGDNKPRPIGSLRKYVDALKEIAGYYGLPVLDFYATSGIQPAVPAIREALCPDGLHPNDRGHEIMAERIANFLKTL